MKTVQKLIALAMAMGIIVACSFASAQEDTLDVYEFNKGDVTLNIHVDSTQSVVLPHEECFIYLNGEVTFYITVEDTDMSIYSSGCSIFIADGYYQVNVPYGAEQVKIAYGGETFVINIR
jgi:cytidylate kinase